MPYITSLKSTTSSFHPHRRVQVVGPVLLNAQSRSSGSIGPTISARKASLSLRLMSFLPWRSVDIPKLRRRIQRVAELRPRLLLGFTVVLALLEKRRRLLGHGGARRAADGEQVRHLDLF